MSQETKRIETTHIDEIGRKGCGTVQWQLEQRNAAPDPTHPISHNSKLEVFICGENSFAKIAADIAAAKSSIDLCCWGFDPGMELERKAAGNWPRGLTFGDALIQAARRGVKVRLLVWYDWKGSPFVHNMPGHSHGLLPWYVCSGSADAGRLSASDSVARLEQELRKPLVFQKKYLNQRIDSAQLHMLAREEYCYSWYSAAFNGLLGELTVTKRHGDRDAIKASLSTEEKQPSSLSDGEFEAMGMTYLGTHHQKTLLIDYAFEKGSKAIGYVMGLNSVTDYWDTCGHLLEDGRREVGGKSERGECVQGMEHDRGFRTAKPYQDYACRIAGGRALIPIYGNFVTAWGRALKEQTNSAARECVTWAEACANPPSELLRKTKAGGSSVQIVRTQPEEQDKTVKEAYFRAVTQAALAAGYLYLENQYFQYEEWARHLLTERRAVMAKWKSGCGKAGKTLEDMPIMHVFIVMPVPEREGMIPRTYDALATLGQQGAMSGQGKMIKKENERKPHEVMAQPGVMAKIPAVAPRVVQHANRVSKPDAAHLESEFGLRVCTAMLNTCGIENGKWRYREIYIHSKLMMIDDTFFTLGSANINQRSMAVDSELNITVVDPALTRDLRKRVWSQMSGGLVRGRSEGGHSFLSDFDSWKRIMRNNLSSKDAESDNSNEKRLSGFILPFSDNRSSTMRLG